MDTVLLDGAREVKRHGVSRGLAVLSLAPGGSQSSRRSSKVRMRGSVCAMARAVLRETREAANLNNCVAVCKV